MNATARLQHHAGFQAPAKSGLSLADAVLLREPIHEALVDLLRTLQVVNLELNGPVPSESTRSEDKISLAIAYAISEITRIVRAAAEKAVDRASKEELEDAAWRIDGAWNAILAGDIDDLLDEDEDPLG